MNPAYVVVRNRIEIGNETVHDSHMDLAGAIRMIQSQRVAKLMQGHTAQINGPESSGPQYQSRSISRS